MGAHRRNMRGCYAVTIDGAISFAVHPTQRVPNHDTNTVTHHHEPDRLAAISFAVHPTQRVPNHDTNTVTHHHEPDRLADRSHGL